MRIVKVSRPKECPWNADDYCANPESEARICPDWSDSFPVLCPLKEQIEANESNSTKSEDK